MQLIVISSPQPVPDEVLIIKQLFEEGLACFHLRKPDYTLEQVEKLLLQINPDFYPRIAFHQFHYQAEAFGIKKLHYTELARSLSDQQQGQAQKDQGYLLSTSVHNLGNLQGIPNWFEYVFFSPVFNSISKQGYTSQLMEGFYLLETEKPIPVIALGGVEMSNIAKVKEMNFDGAALLGAIWSNPQMAVNEFIKIKKKCSEIVPMY